MPSKLVKLVVEARLKEAIDFLMSHPKYASDSQYSNMVIMLSGQLHSLQEQEDNMTITQDYARMQKAKISQSILGTARRYDINDDALPATSGSSQKPVITKNEGAPQILFLASDPREVGKLNLDGEFVEIRTQLGSKATNFNLNIIYDQRPDTLIRTLLDEKPTYIHFAGHGEKGMEGFTPAGIVLQDRDRNPQVVSGPALANMFEMLKEEFEIKVVLLNLCDSMEQARDISAKGIYAIGMAKEIPDNMAITFAGGFYLGLARSPDDIPKAFRYALVTLQVNGFAVDSIPRLFFNEEQVDG